MSKLPPGIRLQIARNTSEEVWKIIDLLEVMRKEVEARELSENVRSSEIDNRKSGTGNEIDNYRKMNQRNKPKYQASAANFDQTNETKPKCVYCREYHFSASCTRVQDSSKRKEILTTDKRCYLCLKTGHITRDCKKQQNCRRCEGRHHQSICQRELQNKSQKMQSKKNRRGVMTKSIQQPQQIQVRPKFFCKQQPHLPFQVRSQQQFQFEFLWIAVASEHI